MDAGPKVGAWTTRVYCTLEHFQADWNCALTVMAGRVPAICARTAGGGWPDQRRAMTPRVSVIIPTFNEAEAITGVIQEIHRDIAHEVIVADGGSTDGTRDIDAAAGARVVDAGR